MALILHQLPGRVGVQIAENGNPQIVGQDDSSNTLVLIELDPAAFRTFLANASRLRGLGIARANRALIVPEDNGG